MRKYWILAGVLVMALLPACGTTRFGWLKPLDRNPPPTKIPTVEDLVAYLNNNAERLQSLNCEDVSLTCSQGSQSFNLYAQMKVQKPRDFRMVGTVGSKQVVDLGSNDQEFWWWISQGDPYQYYCTYKDWSEGKVRNLNFPFQPDWILETMGLGPYTANYEREVDNDTVRLVEKTKSPQGQAIRKVIVFQRRPKQAPQAQVSEFQILDDATGKEICSAHISEVQIDSTSTNAILPRKIELRWPAEKVRLGMKLDHIAVNPGSPRNPRATPIPATAFLRPRNMSGIPSFNLAAGRPDPQIQPVEGRQ